MTDFASSAPIAPMGRSYVTSPKVLELTEPDTQRRLAMGWLGLIVAAGLVLRLLMFALGPAAVSERAMTDATPLHAQLAASLVTSQSFAYDPSATIAGDSQRGQIIELRRLAGQLEAPIGGTATGSTLSGGLQPEVWKMPGYPLLMGLIDGVGGSMTWLLILQCVLGALGCALVYGLVYQVLEKHPPALLAAAVVAVHPAMIIAPLSLSDDVLFVTLLLLGLWAAAKRTSPMAVLAGAAIACAVLVRPISIFVGPAIGLWMVLGDRRAATIGCAMTVAVLSVAGPAMWMGRNVMIDFGLRLSAEPTATLSHTAARVSAAAMGMDEPTLGQTGGAVLEGRGDVLDAMNAASWTTLRQHPRQLGEVLSVSAWHLLTDHRVDTLYRVMGLTYRPGGVADSMREGQVVMPAGASQDKAAGHVALGWMGLNGVLMLGAGLGVALMAGRRQLPLLVLCFAGLGYASFLASGAGVAAWQPVALVFAAMALGAVIARAPARVKVKKEKKPRRTKAKKREDTVFDLDERVVESDPSTREGLAARPI